MDILFEHATPADAAALEALAGATFTDTFGHLYTAENLASHLAKTCSAAFFSEALAREDRIVIARMGDAPVGYVQYGAVSLPVEYGATDGEIQRLYVLDAYQGVGIGKQLMQWALDDPRIRTAPRVFLGVWEENERAKAFYARYGFEKFAEYTYFVGTHADRELILCRENIEETGGSHG